ncbi:shikimate dehydrogenase family protein [Acetanaerobacterium elongatum]|uniref:Shikimate dehydrogenase (NADP(+)) n=1 Tax=Acetanaerobacterium elongatum TaxID=258515 RepID=A0A1G9YZ17_9FIRM|nr:shikimate dehydrogenase [Acetanaerobacterium elongatum]SDN13586.1 shikimate dehydrogenase [Acetanaerobacterium elongatum]
MEKKRYAVIGHPLEHTLSPVLHQKLFALTGVDAEYTAIPIKPEEFAQKAGPLFELDGFNVTMPYKQRIIPYLDGMTEEAMRFEAVNTVSVEECAVADGLATINGSTRPKRLGHNTDIAGVIKSFELLNTSFTGNICIAGAGATAGMLATQIVLKGGSVTIAVRQGSLQKGEALVHSLKRLSAEPKVRTAVLNTLDEPFDLLINATPCGMYPNIDECPFSDNLIAKTKAVFDEIYNPVQTALCEKASLMGKRVLNGLPMLVWQAAEAQQFWYHAVFSEKELLETVDELRFIL